MAEAYDLNTAMGELNSIRDFPSLVSVVNDAYYYSGVPLFPLALLAIVALAVYGKTQNLSATVVAVSLAYVMMYPYIADQLSIYMQIVFGLVVLAAAYVAWRWLMRGTTG